MRGLSERIYQTETRFPAVPINIVNLNKTLKVIVNLLTFLSLNISEISYGFYLLNFFVCSGFYAYLYLYKFVSCCNT